MAEPRFSSRVVVAVALIVITAGGMALWLMRPAPEKPGLAPPDVEGISQAEAERLVELKNVALAHLDRENYAECTEAFGEAADALPTEPLGPRNLMVSHLLALEQIDAIRQKSKHAETLARAERALERLQNVEGDTAPVHALAAKLAQQARDEPRTLEEFAKAAQLSPKDASVWYELFQTGRYSTNEAVKRQSTTALGQAFSLSSDNLFLAIRWMVAQAEAHDPDIIKTLNDAKQSFEPFVETIRQRSRTDISTLLDEAAAGAETGDWPNVLRNVRFVSNVSLPDAAVKSDERRMLRHLSEYVLSDFTPAFYERFSLKRSALAPPIAVKLVPAPLDGPLGQHDDTKDCVLADFDLDGQLDCCVLRNGRLEVHTREPAANRWHLLCSADVPEDVEHLVVVDLDSDFDENVHAARPKADESDSAGASQGEKRSKSTSPPLSGPCAGADVDIVVYGAAGVRVFENRRSGDADAESPRSLAGIPNEVVEGIRRVTSMGVADLDSDGDLDFVVSSETGISLWSNRGNGSFENASDRSTLAVDELRPTAIVPIDRDRDIDIDVVLVGGETGSAGVLENLRHGRFRWQTFTEQEDEIGASSDIVPLDADGNASWDLLACGPSGITLSRTETPEPGVVRPFQTDLVSGFPAERLLCWDFDNDGFEDFIAWNEAEWHAYRGVADGRFELVEELLSAEPRRIIACDAGDLDGDGDTDLMVVDAGRVTAYSNDGGNENRWIDVELRAVQVKGGESSASGRVNSDGIGSLLELRAGLAYQAKVVTRQRTHFGLGERQRADVIRAVWANGIPASVVQPAANQIICEKQQLKGSCPFVYAWNGREYEFVTDLLWASPIGLQFTDGVLAPARYWEYLKLPGEMLEAVDGEYRLRVTEELWEAAYFDHVALIAVDHPAEVNVYSNEKVGPAEIAPFKIHTVRNRRVPVAASNQTGRDVLGVIEKQDGVFLEGFDRKIKQGLTEQHYLELDLGQLERPQQITLFLTGWVYPTDTSINVGLSHNTEVDSPQPPSLWVPGVDGRWREALPYMGFPGGKTKTIAVDLSNVFTADDYRVRIVTNMELYWDAAFFSVDEPTDEIETTELSLLSADLHYRGFSEVVPQLGHGPDRYDYARVSRTMAWPPMNGRFSRYGDVAELIADADDRLAILGAGDEMTLTFQAPRAATRPGWKRDFILHNVGWDKDADLNTVYGETVEPLPFRAMSGYPYPAVEGIPESEPYREYLRTYQTRSQRGGPFWGRIQHYMPNESAAIDR